MLIFVSYNCFFLFEIISSLFTTPSQNLNPENYKAFDRYQHPTSGEIISVFVSHLVISIENEIFQKKVEHFSIRIIDLVRH